MSDRYERGMETRRRVLGAAHVERATANVTPVDADFQRWITESVWAELWSRPQLDLRTRSIVTVALLAALGREELDLHLEAAKNTGASAADLAEALMHVAVYAGVPAANHAFARLKRIHGMEAKDE